jgi:hypothetical protein
VWPRRVGLPLVSTDPKRGGPRWCDIAEERKETEESGAAVGFLLLLVLRLPIVIARLRSTSTSKMNGTSRGGSPTPLGPLWDTLLLELNITRTGRMHLDGRTAQRF